ncbi:MAG: hypothetical protein GY943_08850 [Chloroflexi bacterium]|nr:hypothetical protein [Chloroflexota bacterium]
MSSQLRQIKLSRQYWPIIAGIGVFILYLVVAKQGGGLGFPLDDAWIHQTYARNFVRNGRWEFVPGVISGGSTSPLWTLLLAVGYLLRVPYLWWAYFCGAFSLIWLALMGMRVWRLLWPDLAVRDWIAGVVIVCTWPLIWAAASGMETLFFAALGMSIIAIYLEIVTASIPKWIRFGQMGLLSGLLILTRPDGLVLLLLIGLGLLITNDARLVRVKWVAIYVGTAVLPVLPYFFFNWMVSGLIWPNTFYAKQTEYASLLATPLINRVVQLLYFSVGGPSAGWQGMSTPHLILLPGLLFAGWHSVRLDISKRRLFYTLPLLWAGGHVCLYAWRLPLAFQHGRYLLAAIPIWILFGLVGWMKLLFDRSLSRPIWVAQQVSRFTFIGLLSIFLILGARAYMTDVAFVEGEMVVMARWIAENTSNKELIASHDIGAIGYFAERPLLDLAGLISPEMIPLLDNEALLANYIQESDAHYLVTAPGWSYEDVVINSHVEQLFSTEYAWTQENGRNNMTIYLLQPP